MPQVELPTKSGYQMVALAAVTVNYAVTVVEDTRIYVLLLTEQGICGFSALFQNEKCHFHHIL